MRGHPLDILDARQALPAHGEVWMSQFQDCFSPLEILAILRRVRTAMPANASVYILQMFWDRQQFETAAHSLNAGSLFSPVWPTATAASDDFLVIVAEAGFGVAEQVDNVGLGHTLLRLVAA